MCLQFMPRPSYTDVYVFLEGTWKYSALKIFKAVHNSLDVLHLTLLEFEASFSSWMFRFTICFSAFWSSSGIVDHWCWTESNLLNKSCLFWCFSHAPHALVCENVKAEVNQQMTKPITSSSDWVSQDFQSTRRFKNVSFLGWLLSSKCYVGIKQTDKPRKFDLTLLLTL